MFVSNYSTKMNEAWLEGQLGVGSSNCLVLHRVLKASPLLVYCITPTRGSGTTQFSANLPVHVKKIVF